MVAVGLYTHELLRLLVRW